MPKVSIVIPVYGVEKYIERCARSLFEQSLDDIEYLFVDDCTPDESINVLNRVLEDYPLRKTQVIIHRMKQNSGQAKVREWGIKNATGDYVIHCDSDDWVDRDMYRALYEAAVKEDADVAICDFARTDGENLRVECGCHSTDPNVFTENCLFQKDKWSLCNKLFKRSCYSGITFPQGALGEDMMMCIQMLSNTYKMVYIAQVFYFYYTNPNSITKRKTIAACEHKYLTLKENTDFIIDFINNNLDHNTIDVGLACKYLKMNNLMSSIAYIKHIPKYRAIWRRDFEIMPLRYFFNKKISSYDKVFYTFAAMGLFPKKSERACS